MPPPCALHLTSLPIHPPQPALWHVVWAAARRPQCGCAQLQSAVPHQGPGPDAKALMATREFKVSPARTRCGGAAAQAAQRLGAGCPPAAALGRGAMALLWLGGRWGGRCIDQPLECLPTRAPQVEFDNGCALVLPKKGRLRRSLVVLCPLAYRCRCRALSVLLHHRRWRTGSLHTMYRPAGDPQKKHSSRGNDGRGGDVVPTTRFSPTVTSSPRATGACPTFECPPLIALAGSCLPASPLAASLLPALSALPPLRPPMLPLAGPSTWRA